MFPCTSMRSMCRITKWHTRKHCITTAELCRRLGLDCIDTYISRRQLRWLGHVARMEFKERLPRQMLTCWVAHNRWVGSPEMTYGRGIRKALDKFGFGRFTWPTQALDRALWYERIKTSPTHCECRVCRKKT